MGTGSAVRLLLAGAVWRLVAFRPAGRALLAALTGPDPADRELAGILLTQAGDRSVPLLATALDAGIDPAEPVTVLASIGSARAREVLARAATSDRPALADAAARTLRNLPPP